MNTQFVERLYVPAPNEAPAVTLHRRITSTIAFVKRLVWEIRAVAVVVIAALIALAPMRVSRAASFSIDVAGLMDSAASIFNGLWPAFAIIAGLALGFLILKFVLQSIRGAMGG